jgi:hypothetical protein
MRSYFLLPFIAWTLSFIQITFPQSKIIFTDNFSSYHDGSDGTPIWHPLKGNWQMIGKRYNQKSAEYDCASMLDIYLDQSFEIETVFEQTDGDLGAGFIFSSVSRDNIDFAQLVRFDGNGILLTGYYQDGEFNATKSCKAPMIQPATTHTLTLRVRPNNDRYSVLLDKREIISGAILRYPSGYIGLQSSGGQVRYHNVKMTSLRSKTKSSGLEWIHQFTFSTNNEIVVPNQQKGVIQFYDLEGTLLKEIGSSINNKGEIDKPSAVSFLNDSTLLVTDCGRDRLEMFDIKGRWLNSVGWHGKELGQFNHPSAIKVNNRRQIFVVDRDNNRVQVLNDSLKPLTQFGGEQLSEPSDIAIRGNTIYVLNTGLCRIECYSWTGTSAIWNKCISYGGGKGRGLAVSHDTIYLSVVNEVRAYDTTGTLLQSFRGRSENFILPQGIVVGNDNRIYIADFFYGRIIGTTHDLLDPSPRITYPDSTSAIIEWESAEEWVGTISYPTRGSCIPSTEHDSSDSMYRHKVVLHDLEPGTCMPITFLPTLTSIPNRLYLLRKPRYTITPPMRSHSKLFSRLPMATIIFTNIANPDSLSATRPQPQIIADSEIRRIEAQINDGIRFYWIHSGMRFFIDNEFIIVNDRLKRDQLYGNDWWYPPKDSMIEHYLKVNNRDIKNYSGLLYITCTQQYDTSLKSYSLSGKGGAFTNGVGTGKGYGISWWDATRTNHNAGNNWLMVHEFNHQLDDIFLQSGYPEYLFNHISPTIGTAAYFGEHFDANAYILRIVPSEEWFDLKFTTHSATSDRDEDGIPDNDPALPLDEVRLGSDSLSTDTDNDGVPDFNELRFSNWITDGWGETYGGKKIFPALNNADTDADGISDQTDPESCYPNTTDLQYRAEANEYPLIHFHDSTLTASISGSWNEDSLYFTIEATKVVSVKLMIDGNNDGWFCGRENYSIQQTFNPDQSYSSLLQFLNCTDPHRWPYNENIQPGKIYIRSSIQGSDSISIISVHIPADRASGFSLLPNHNIGISIGLRLPDAGENNKRYISIFEPNRFCIFTLVK